MSRLLFYLMVAGFFIASKSQAQSFPNDTLEIKLITRYTPDSVLLRWAPTNFQGWQYGNTVGYRITRNTLRRNDQALSVGEMEASRVVLEEALMLQTPAFWQTVVDTNELAGVAAGAIYGEDFRIKEQGDDLVKIYQNVQEQQNRFGLALFAADQSMELAQWMGLGFVDTQIRVGEQYLYELAFAKDTAAYHFRNGQTMVDARKEGLLTAPANVVASFANKQVRLSWPTLNLQGAYSSFFVERSVDNGQSFQPAHKNPLLFPSDVSKPMSFMDTLPDNRKSYAYRVRGKTPFGEWGPPSLAVEGKGKVAPLAAQIILQKIEEIATAQISLAWEFPSELDSKTQGFDIYRSATKKGIFEKINIQQLPANSRSFIDPAPMLTNYYQIRAIDENGNELRSYALLGQIGDAIPPAAPSALQGIISQSGQAQIRWSANQEEDILGYRVYTSNQPNGNYAQLTARHTRDTAYLYEINLQNLASKVYYKVIAVDHRENYSDFSKVLELERPDVVPPATPIFRQVKSAKTGVFFSWGNSASTDVVLHQLQRKAVFQEDWLTIAALRPDSSYGEFLDTTASANYDYFYRLLAIDEAGLQSSSKIVEAKPIDDGQRPAISNLSITPVNQNHSIKLQWTYPARKDIYRFVVYRSKGEGDMVLYKSFTPNEVVKYVGNGRAIFYTEDKGLQQGVEYGYQLLARYVDGGFSPLTELVVGVIGEKRLGMRSEE